MTAPDSRGCCLQAGRPAGGAGTPAHRQGVPGRDGPAGVVSAALYGRADGIDGGTASCRYRQLAAGRAAAAACGWQVIPEFFAEERRAGNPWHRLPHGPSLLVALSGPGRLAGAVVVAVPWRLLLRRPVPGRASILARVVPRRVLLVLARTITGLSACERRPPGGIAVPGLHGDRGQPR
jgi:hypothetical protein